MNLDDGLLARVIESSHEGILICELHDGMPAIVFANAAFEELSGYAAADLIGRDPGFLHADDTDQEGLIRIRDAIRDGQSCKVVLRNYRRDGSLLWNEMSLLPLRDASGQVRHFASYHRDRDERRQAPALDDMSRESIQRDPAVMEDRLTGLVRRTYFDERLQREWDTAAAEQRRVTLYLFDIDCFAEYETACGRFAGEQVLPRIGRTVSSCFRRTNDLCARFDYDEFGVIAARSELAQSLAYAETIQSRVRELAIHHPASTVARILTVSVGIATTVPQAGEESEMLVQAVVAQLEEAKNRGRNRVVGKELHSASDHS